MKKLQLLSLLLFCLLLAGCGKKTESTHQVGDMITFGNYQGEAITWQVLDVKDGKLFLLSEYVLDAKAFDDNGSSSWEDSSLRQWLNGEFYETAFGDEEKTVIEKTASKEKVGEYNSRVPGSSYEYDDRTTQDYVAVLSHSEVWHYLLNPDETLNLCYPTEYAKNHTNIDLYNDACAWWTCTSNKYTNNIYYGSQFMSMTEKGRSVTDDTVGVRPAIWIDGR